MKIKPAEQRPLNTYINDLFLTFMHETGIKDGLPKTLDEKIESAADALLDALTKAYYWRQCNPTPDYTKEATFMTQDGAVEVLRWGVDDYSAEFLDADYSVRGSLRDIIAEPRF